MCNRRNRRLAELALCTGSPGRPDNSRAAPQAAEAGDELRGLLPRKRHWISQPPQGEDKIGEAIKMIAELEGPYILL